MRERMRRQENAALVTSLGFTAASAKKHSKAAQQTRRVNPLEDDIRPETTVGTKPINDCVDLVGRFRCDARTGGADSRGPATMSATRLKERLARGGGAQTMPTEFKSNIPMELLGNDGVMNRVSAGHAAKEAPTLARSTTT